RVIVEFEYTDISYLRSLYATQTEYKGDKWSVNLNIYSEQDSKSTTGDLQLDSTDIRILQESGDDLTRSVRSSLRTISDAEKKEATRILYAGTLDIFDPANIILRFTENLDSAQYTAVFTEVGAGKGDYAIDNTKNRNARVYKYVGKNLGSYLPVIQLIPPEQKQLITLNGRYVFNKNSDVFAELGLSNLDKNRRSPIDNNDNTGLSSHIAVKHSISLDSASHWVLGGTLKHEYVHKNFNALNPFRAPEFVRDWNITQIPDKGDENLIMGTIGIKSKSGLGLEYGYNSFDRSGVYQGEKHAATIRYQGKRWKMKAFANALESQALTLDQQSSFVRPNITMQYGLDRNNRWTIGAELDAESNKIRGIRTDTLSKASFSFQHLKWYLASDFTKDFALKLAFSTRDEQFALNNELRRASFGREVEVAGKWTAKVGSDLSWSLIGRDFEVIEQALLPNDKSKKTVLGRVDYLLSAFNGGVRSTTSYNTNSGQEPKIEYVFQKVEVGQGDYFYIGESDNPNLTNILDFRYDPTNPLSRYIRLTLTNNEFIRTNNIEINQNLAIDPSKF
ncbi:MAG: hypothetical protein WBO36_11370, partial [Saprospiraceae bacterium]